MASACSGGLITHLDGTIAGCTDDENIDGGGCAGRYARHMGEPRRCVDVLGDCDYCGIVRL